MEKQIQPASEPLQTATTDILIVGAGISGLTSAVKILQKERSLQVKILEATNAIGGQIGESRLGEIGGKWITEDQHHIHRLLHNLKITTRKRIVIAPQLKRCWDIDRGIFSIFARYELSRYIHELELRVAFFKPGRYNIRKRYGSMDKHICNRLFFNKSRNFMRSLVQLICGVDARDATYSEFMSICYTCGGLRILIDFYFRYLECPNSLLEISSAKLLQVFSEKLKIAEILFWRKVYEIRHYKDHVEVIDSQYEVHTANVVILAIPWNSIQDIYIAPPIPMELRKPPPPLENSKQMLTSFIAHYNEGHWRTAGYSGNFLSSEPLIVGHEYRPTTYSGLTVHEEGIEPLVRSIVLQTLAQHFGEEMLLPTEFHQRTFEMSSVVNAPFTTPWNRIIWSSSAAAATAYRGCLSGAVQSGLRAAMNALLVVRPQTVTWQDIAEVHQSDNRLKRDASLFSLWTSTWNLYNVTVYSAFLCGVVAVLRQLYKKNLYSAIQFY